MTARCYTHGVNFVNGCTGCSQAGSHDRLETRNKMLHDFRCAALSGLSGKHFYAMDRYSCDHDKADEIIVHTSEGLAQAMLKIARGES